MRERFATPDYRRPADPANYTVLWCQACAYGRLAGTFTPQQVSQFYDVPGYYDHWDSQRQPSFQDRLRVRLAWQCDSGQDLAPQEVSGQSLCDIGCGAGHQLRLFRNAGFTVTGVETNAAARLLAGREALVHPGTAEQLPTALHGEQFDVVLLSHVLEHCLDPALALRNARTLLNPGGTLVVEVPNNAAYGFEQFGAAWPWTDVPRHLHFFTARSLATLLAKTGFLVRRTFYTGYTRQFKPEWLATQNRIQPGRPYTRLAWAMLARTAFSTAARKYDSVRLHATLA